MSSMLARPIWMPLRHSRPVARQKRHFCALVSAGVYCCPPAWPVVFLGMNGLSNSCTLSALFHWVYMCGALALFLGSMDRLAKMLRPLLILHENLECHDSVTATQSEKHAQKRSKHWSCATRFFSAGPGTGVGNVACLAEIMALGRHVRSCLFRS